MISAFLVLAVYLTSQSFQEWNDEPVLTTLKNTALPIDKVSHVIIKFPNQNSCKQGGRRCAGAQGAPAKKFGLGRKF